MAQTHARTPACHLHLQTWQGRPAGLQLDQHHQPCNQRCEASRGSALWEITGTQSSSRVCNPAHDSRDKRIHGETDATDRAWAHTALESVLTDCRPSSRAKQAGIQGGHQIITWIHIFKFLSSNHHKRSVTSPCPTTPHLLHTPRILLAPTHACCFRRVPCRPQELVVLAPGLAPHPSADRRNRRLRVRRKR